MATYPEWWNQTEEELMQQTLQQLDPKWSKREGEFMYDSLRAYVQLRAMSRMELKNVLSMHFVMEATGEILDKVVESRSPLKRFLEKYATGLVKVMGNPKTKLPADTRYMSIVYNGEQEPIEFTQVDDATVGSDGVAYVLVKSLTAGRIGNIPAGTIEIASPIVGVASVVNEEVFENGADREDDDTFRERYLRWLRESGSSGNISDYIRWSLEVDGVGGVQVLPLWNGRGTVKLLLIDQNYYPAGDDVIKRAIDYICPVLEEGRGKAPIGASVTIETASVVNIDVSATVTFAQTTDLNTVTSTFSELLLSHLLNLNKTYWKNSIYPETYVVNYLKIGSLIVDTPDIVTVTDLTINGGVDNISIVPGQVALVGEVKLVEG